MGETGSGRLRRRARRDAREFRDLILSPRERRSFLAHLRDPRRLSVRQQHVLLLLVLVAFVAAWAAAAALLRATAPGMALAWDALWALALVSFTAAIAVPLPGATSALLVALGGSPVLLAFGVAGAAIGGTAGAAVVYYVGGAVRRSLESRANGSAWSRRVFAWGKGFAQRWTYVGIAGLISLPFVPRPVVLYLASILDLEVAPYLGAVFAGMVLRTAIVAFGASLVAGFV
jgi:uncharacterized membrane protein YdjX (TVP38/TMEM64 family)